jgi:hypothetical protein
VGSGNNNTNRNSTLPLPELNPLLNPVLGAHMGRWAEVYFTSPPEKREEAVLELLRELQGEAAATGQTPDGAVAKPPETPVKQPKIEATKRPTRPPSEPERANAQWIVCESCGGRNVLGNRFCGMCGSPLSQEAAAPSKLPKATMWGSFVEHHQEEAKEHSAELEDADSRETLSAEADRYPRDPQLESRPHESLRPTEYFTAAEPQTSSMGSWPDRPAVPSLIPEYDEAPSRRRVYLGAVVGIVILGLVYVAWKSSTVRSDASHALPQPAPAAAESQPTPADQTPSQASQPDAQAPASVPPPVVERKPTVATSSPRRKPAADEGTLAAVPTPQAQDQGSGPVVASLEGNGSEELTVAESYLNGTRGRMKDSTEAAKWLWRSFGKKNGTSALLLSDLYVRGDGVPQSCDQARVLLGAAARNGTPDATARLRTLPARGCP